MLPSEVKSGGQTFTCEVIQKIIFELPAKGDCILLFPPRKFWMFGLAVSIVLFAFSEILNLVWPTHFPSPNESLLLLKVQGNNLQTVAMFKDSLRIGQKQPKRVQHCKGLRIKLSAAKC